MLSNRIKTRAWDKSILLPAIVLAVQSVPWFATRLRMRALAPIMALYILHSLTSGQSKSTSRERSAAIGLLISGFIFFETYLITHSQFYDKFLNPWFVSSTFGLFFMWVFIRLAMDNKVREIKILALITVGALAIGAYMGGTYLGDAGRQDIIRQMTGGGATDWDMRDAWQSGVGGFGTVYSAGMLSVALFYAGIFVRLRLRMMLWLSGVFMLIYAYRAGFTILIATMIFGFLSYGLSLSIAHYPRYRMLMIAMITFIMVVTLTPGIASFVASPLIKLSHVVNNENYVMRLTSIAEAITGAENDYAIFRTGLMWRSWNVFLAHPFAGATYSIGLIGGHSFFFDHLAIGGLVGFIPYPFFVYYYERYLRLVIFPLSPHSRVLISTYFYMWVLCTFLNPLDSATVWASMFLVLPGISLFFKDSKLNRMPGRETENWVENR